MKPIDLHAHSTKSDGSYTPEALIRYAREKGLAAVALTDHDTVDGIEEALETAEKLRHEAALKDRSDSRPVPEVIPGVELSTKYNEKDIHIVGLFIDWQDPVFRENLRRFADARIYRNMEMCRRLTEGGYRISYDDLQAAFPDTVITRAHFAQYLSSHGIVSSVKEAFRRLIGDDCPYFVPREKITPYSAIEYILKFGGVPVLAHPLQYRMTEASLCELTASLSAYGLAGIEVYYAGYKPADTAYLCRIADRYGLLYSGGSDFHGTRKENLDLGTGYGHLYVPEIILPPLKAFAECRKT